MKSVSYIITICQYLTLQVNSGNEASYYKYPFLVSVQSTGTGHICSGSLLSFSWVLTSTHCVLEHEKTPEDLNIIAGEPNTEDEQMRFVEKIYCHDKFDTISWFNNIALLQTDKPFHKKKSVDFTYVPKYTMHIEIKTKCKTVEVVGLEKTSENVTEETNNKTRLRRNVFRPEMESFTHKVLSNEECIKIRKFAVLKHTFCGYSKNMTACLLDTGGPAICENMIYGINFYGCPWDKSPSYFTRVDRYLMFIERIMGRDAPYRTVKRSSADKVSIGFFTFFLFVHCFHK